MAQFKPWILPFAMVPLNALGADMENWQVDFHVSGAWIETRDVRIDDSGVRVSTPNGDPPPRCASLSASDIAYIGERVESIVAFMGEDRVRIWGQRGLISEVVFVLRIAVPKEDGLMSHFRFVLDSIPRGELEPERWGGEAPPLSIAELLDRARQLSESTLTPCASGA